MTAFRLTRRRTSTPTPAPRPVVEVVPTGGTCEPVPVSLAEAAAAAMVSDRVLWVEYLTLGGTRDLGWFRAHLHATDTADEETQAEHAVVVAMFTELFADEGIALHTA